MLSELQRHWAFGDVAELSQGRVGTEETIQLLADLIDGSRNQNYAHAPDQFTQDIDRLIFLKRSIFATEIVLD